MPCRYIAPIDANEIWLTDLRSHRCGPRQIGPPELKWNNRQRFLNLDRVSIAGASNKSKGFRHGAVDPARVGSPNRFT
jgi:hypothetical protein